MRQRGSASRAFRRAVVCALGALLVVGATAAPAFALPPDAPAAPSVVAKNLRIDVSFVPPADNGSPITVYIASCTSSDGGAPGAAAGTTSPISVTGLNNGNTYTCTVDATNADGTSPESPPSTAVVPAPTIPDTLAQPAVAFGDSLITVTFVAPNDEGSPITSYGVTCTSSNGGAPGSNSGGASPITVVGLTNGKTYTCNVVATNGIGSSAASPDSAPVVPAGVPAAPAAPTVARGNALIVVSFVAPVDNGSPITSYSATCTSSDGGTPGTGSGAVSPVTVNALTNAKTYTCHVAATNAAGPGPVSPDSAAIVVGVPNAPAAPTVAAGNTKIIVNVVAPADNGSPITSYTASCTSSDGGVPGTISASASPVTVTGLTNAKTYTCTVFATNAVGPGPVSPSSLTAVPAAVPDPPLQPTVVFGNAQIAVSFLPPLSNGSPITSYTASCASSDGGTPRAHSGTVSPITVTGLTNGSTYTCTVAARSVVGLGPPSPASIAVVPATIPVAPTIRAAGPRDGALAVSFTPNSDNGRPITGFTATCSSSNGGAPGSMTGTGSPIIVPGLTNGDIYRCSVKATNVLGTSLGSSPSVPIIVGQPGAPTIGSVVPGLSLGSRGGFHVSFGAGPDNGSPITAFRLTCSPVTTGIPGLAIGHSSPMAITGMSAGHLYSCVVVATNARGTSVQSNAVRAIVGAPVPPLVTDALPLAHRLVMPLAPTADNGNAITGYQARCKSSDGGVAASPFAARSPLVASNLTADKAYTCLVTAINARGESAATPVGPVVIASSPVDLPSCVGHSGGMHVTPGLLLSDIRAHTTKLEATLGTCTGPYVRQAHISVTLHSKQPFSCTTAIDVANAGSGTITWTAPVGRGSSGAAISLVITSSFGHSTSAEFHGVVTSRGNMFSDYHVDGTVTLDQGLDPTGTDGDCDTVTRLQKFRVSTATLTIS